MSNPFKANSLSITGISEADRNLLKTNGTAVDGQIVYITSDVNGQAITPRYEYFDAASNDFYELGSGPIPDSTFISLTDPDGNYYSIPYTVGGLEAGTDPAGLDGTPVNDILQLILYPELEASRTLGTHTITGYFSDDLGVTWTSISSVNDANRIVYGTSLVYKWTSSFTLGGWTAQYSMFDALGASINVTLLNYWGAATNAVTTLKNVDGRNWTFAVGNGDPANDSFVDANDSATLDMKTLEYPLLATVELQVSRDFAQGDLAYTSRKAPQSGDRFTGANIKTAVERVYPYKPFFSNETNLLGSGQDFSTPTDADQLSWESGSNREFLFDWAETDTTERMGIAIPADLVSGDGVQIYGWDDNLGVYFSANSNGQWTISTATGWWTAPDGSQHDYVIATTDPAQGDNTNMKIKVTWT